MYIPVKEEFRFVKLERNMGDVAQDPAASKRRILQEKILERAHSGQRKLQRDPELLRDLPLDPPTVWEEAKRTDVWSQAGLGYHGLTGAKCNLDIPRHDYFIQLSFCFVLEGLARETQRCQIAATCPAYDSAANVGCEGGGEHWREKTLDNSSRSGDSSSKTMENARPGGLKRLFDASYTRLRTTET